MDEILFDESENIRNKLQQEMMQFNLPYLKLRNPKPFSFYYQDNAKNIIAGITGYYANKYARVDYTWVHENYRHKKLGKKLFTALEFFLREHHCEFIQLDTFDFQAKPFYEKLGFICVGMVPKWIEGHDCYFMRKRIS